MSLFGMASSRRFTRALWAVAEGFVTHRGGVHPPAYYLNMIEEQVRESREHREAGRATKARNELADIIAVAFEALHADGVDPERVTVERIHSRILPHIAEIEGHTYTKEGRKVAHFDIGPDAAHAADALPRVALSRARASKWLSCDCWDSVVHEGDELEPCGVGFEPMKADPSTCKWCAHVAGCHGYGP